MSATVAIIGMVLVTFMWGSWFQTVKHIKDYPIIAYTFWLYFFSPIIVWTSILCLHKQMVPDGVLNEIDRYPGKAMIVFLCGMIFAIGMQLQMGFVKRLGLILSTSVSASSNVLASTFITSFVGGLPEGASFPKILTASLMLIAATIICQTAGARRSKDIHAGTEEKEHVRKVKKSDILALALINALMLTAFPLSMSLTLKSGLRPEGFSSLTLMGILSLGAFIGSLIFTLSYLKKKGGMDRLFEPWKKGNRKILVLAFISAVCHFGGNVLQSIFSPVISVAIATPMGTAYNVWSYFWGVLYGEFKGSSKRTYGVLILGVLFFIGGVLLLTSNIV